MIGYSIKSSILENRFIFTELEAVVNSSAGEIKNRIINTMMDTFENEVQKRLIELGWTPPVEAQRLNTLVTQLQAELRAQDLNFEAMQRDFAAASASLTTRLQQTREELEVTDKLLAARNEALGIIPECEAHGPQCVPHAKEWIENMKSRYAENPHCFPADHDPNQTSEDHQVGKSFKGWMVKSKMSFEKRGGEMGRATVWTNKRYLQSFMGDAELVRVEVRVTPERRKPLSPPKSREHKNVNMQTAQADEDIQSLMDRDYE